MGRASGCCPGPAAVTYRAELSARALKQMQGLPGVPEVFQLVVGPGEAEAAVQVGRGQVAGTSTV